MKVATIVQQGIAVFALALGLISTGCNKKTDAEPKQNVQIAPGPQPDELDVWGNPNDRNRPVAIGSTHLRGDGIEELNIPVREADWPAVGVGSTRVQDDGKEELIIPLRERVIEEIRVMPRVVGQ